MPRPRRSSRSSTRSPTACPRCSRSPTTSRRSRPDRCRRRLSRGCPTPLAPRGAVRRAARSRDLAAALAGARRPFLLAGRGAWLAGAGDALGALADATGRAHRDRRRSVAASSPTRVRPRRHRRVRRRGRDGAHPRGRRRRRLRGIAQPVHDALRRAVRARAPASFQVDIAPAATHPHVGGFIRGDAAVVAERARSPSSRRDRRRAERMARSRSTSTALRDATTRATDVAPDGRLDPRAVARRIGELLPDDRVVVSDGGHFIGWANMYWPVASPDRMMMVGTAYQSIGLGLPERRRARRWRSPTRRSCSRPATAAA